MKLVTDVLLHWKKWKCCSRKPVIKKKINSYSENLIYLIDDGQELFILKIHNYKHKKLLLNISQEIKIHSFFSQKNISPFIYYSCNQYAVMEYIGSHINQNFEINWYEFGRFLKRVHDVRTSALCVGILNINKYCEEYLFLLKKRNSCFYNKLKFLFERHQDSFESIQIKSDTLCHLDLHRKNIFYVKTKGFQLIDWEYSCVSNIMLDIVSLHSYFNLTSYEFSQLQRGYDLNLDCDLFFDARITEKFISLLWWTIKSPNSIEQKQLLNYFFKSKK